MGLLDYDFEEMASRLQHGLDRLTANYLTSHRARVRYDVVDFHGREHLDFELQHDGHALRVRQVGPSRGIGEPPAETLEEFESLFDGQPSASASIADLAAWLAALPPGKAAVELAPPPRDAANPFLAESPLSPSAPKRPNPFLEARPEGARDPNPFAPPTDAELRKRRAREWLGGDE